MLTELYDIANELENLHDLVHELRTDLDDIERDIPGIVDVLGNMLPRLSTLTSRIYYLIAEETRL